MDNDYVAVAVRSPGRIEPYCSVVVVVVVASSSRRVSELRVQGDVYFLSQIVFLLFIYLFLTMLIDFTMYIIIIIIIIYYHKIYFDVGLTRTYTSYRIW